MKQGSKDIKKMTMEEEEEKKKRTSRPKKKHTYGGLPSMDDAQRVATQSDSGIARSMGGLAVAPPPPGLHHIGGLPRMQPTMSMMPPSHFGAKMAPSPGMMAVPTGPLGHSHVGPGTSVRGEPNGWRFRDVPTLPENHPLEQTAVFVPHSEAPEVGQRVADVLRERSIVAEYDDDKARAKCVTESGVEFNVRLYRGKNKFSHGIICEVQRRFGFCPSFAQDTYAVLDAAEGKVPTPKTAPLGIPPPPALVPSAVSAFVSGPEDDDDDFDDFDADLAFASPSAGVKRRAPGVNPSSLCIASDMLKRAKTVDANVLALEGLAKLTDSEKMGPSAALRVSRQILAPSDEGRVVRDAVVSLLVDETLDTTESTTADVWDKDDEGRAGLRLGAMNAFANAVSVASSSGTPALLEDQSVFLAEDIIPTLVSELRESKKNVRMAMASAKCLKGLLTSKTVGKNMIASAIECDAEPALRNALDVGQRGNKHLEEASSDCLKAIGKC